MACEVLPLGGGYLLAGGSGSGKWLVKLVADYGSGVAIGPVFGHVCRTQQFFSILGHVLQKAAYGHVGGVGGTVGHE